MIELSHASLDCNPFWVKLLYINVNVIRVSDIDAAWKTMFTMGVSGI